MKKNPVFTICLLSLACGFQTPKALAITPETFAKAEVRQTPALNTVAALEKQAQQLYETGQFADAIAVLQRLVTDYTAQGNQLGQVRALRNLALVYHQAGERTKATAAITDSFNQLNQIENTAERTKLFAQILEVKGQLELSAGNSEQALETWKKAAEKYKQIGDATGVTRNQINQAQSLQVLGLYSQALKMLKTVKETLKNQPDTLLKARGFQSLGDALRIVGDLNQSQEVLQQSLAIAEKLESPEALTAAMISLGNTFRVQQKPEAALDFYQRAVKASPTPLQTIEAQLNQLSLLLEQKQWSEAKILSPKIEFVLAKLPASRTAVYARINLAHSLIKIGQRDEEQQQITNYQEPAQLLAMAVKLAQSLKDRRAEANALGNLGKLYEHNQQWADARKLTEKALLLAQAVNAADIAYQWQWQLGRIMKVQGEREGAITAYFSAVKTLQSLRSDLVSISSDVQFSFTESVEPVYRELVGLLLQPPLNSSQSHGVVDQLALIQARQIIEALQVAELDNFFRDACLDIRPVQIDQIDPKAAVFYPIILRDRLEVIVKLPNKPLRHYTTFVSEERVEEILRKLREGLTRSLIRGVLKILLEPSQQAYDWLIRPIETELAASGVQTLVFVLDGSLRSIPMAALYDGKQYLAQKYSIAIAPGLQLVDAKPLARNSLKILTGGLSESRQGFDALPGVETELQRIAAEVPSTILLNESFTEANLKAKINSFPFPVVHLATHGEFSSKAENTFILAWDERINAKELDSLLRGNTRTARPIELLVLSACRTAVGDKRAALGLAGVAVRAGARSTMASLWYVSDEATALLMTKFYEELAKKEVTKAEALRRAQQAIFQDKRFSHPYFWAAFVLVGNWL
ncbi:CHAT domain-containing protein [Kamptonema animale CS-326]|jgi:CHAT domain-containing protein|uniref:CHAT domain-containing protein n=1 Tax=Kamptonema animale TaxID=92934 RepID=UPI00232D8967|nr:CHAT domain-containing protein [Kamptonema animale]MDB9509742.1 CHAT domain-containing protein [Kamptonema animale CS-326]